MPRLAHLILFPGAKDAAKAALFTFEISTPLCDGVTKTFWVEQLAACSDLSSYSPRSLSPKWKAELRFP